MLTLQQLKEMAPGSIFASGTDKQYGEQNIRWVACRGDIHDWAIYIGNERDSFQRVAEYGNKTREIKRIMRYVPCDKEAFDMYRIF